MEILEVRKHGRPTQAALQPEQTRDEQPLTTHAALEHRPRAAVEGGPLALQGLGVGHDHLGGHVEGGEGLLAQRPLQTVGELLQGPQKPPLVDHLHRVVPSQGQRDACWENEAVLSGA